MLKVKADKILKSRESTESGIKIAVRSRAFTLIELLVVIAIIALLVSVLLPSLNRAKMLAKKVACKSNFHTLSIACAIYEQEENSMLQAEWVGGWMWLYAIRPYIDATPLGSSSALEVAQVLICPEDATGGGFASKGARPWGLADSQTYNAHSYGYSSVFGWKMQGAPYTHTSDLPNPSEGLLICDQIWWKIGSWTSNICPTEVWANTLPDSEEWHEGDTNIMFADYSVRSLDSSTMFMGEENERYWYGGFDPAMYTGG